MFEEQSSNVKRVHKPTIGSEPASLADTQSDEYWENLGYNERTVEKREKYVARAHTYEVVFPPDFGRARDLVISMLLGCYGRLELQILGCMSDAHYEKKRGKRNQDFNDSEIPMILFQEELIPVKHILQRHRESSLLLKFRIFPILSGLETPPRIRVGHPLRTVKFTLLLADQFQNFLYSVGFIRPGIMNRLKIMFNRSSWKNVGHLLKTTFIQSSRKTAGYDVNTRKKRMSWLSQAYHIFNVLDIPKEEWSGCGYHNVVELYLEQPSFPGCSGNSRFDSPATDQAPDDAEALCYLFLFPPTPNP
ncbi:hypothetical protein L218DRAFT_949391 [Marasmius fiardii PR-910]|nr:hypothetical protein L218DRAFT_949391 [Marasmius fiardii PR-910]